MLRPRVDQVRPRVAIARAPCFAGAAVAGPGGNTRERHVRHSQHSHAALRHQAPHKCTISSKQASMSRVSTSAGHWIPAGYAHQQGIQCPAATRQEVGAALRDEVAAPTRSGSYLARTHTNTQDRQIDTHRDRQTDRQTDRERDRETERQRDRETERQREMRERETHTDVEIHNDFELCTSVCTHAHTHRCSTSRHPGFR